MKTPEGYALAHEVLAGDRILTDKGPARVVSATTQPYSGTVHSFTLGNSRDEEAKFTDDNTNFFANGILIADNRLCRLVRDRHTRRLETILKKLPPAWHDEARRAYPKQSTRRR